MAEDRWPELCRLVEEDDGLPTRTSGPWTEDKLFLWNRYIDIATRAMVGNPKWPSGLVYVDLFSGPGVCTLDDSKRRIPGSPLIAANAPKPFRKILLCDLNRESVEACKSRLARLGRQPPVQMFDGDCNKRVRDIVAEIPAKALTLAFIDPTGLHAHFETIRVLASRGRVDLLILFADAYDIVRNVDTYYRNPNSNLDRVLGPDSGWRREWDGLENRSSSNIRKMFADIYRRQLGRHLRYRAFGEEIVTCKRGALYRLVYASKHERGLEFWNKISNKDPSGQKRLFH